MFSTIRRLFTSLVLGLALTGCIIVPSTISAPITTQPVATVAEQARSVTAQLSYTNLTDSFCTVVVIAPEKALTAKHCVPQGLAEDAPEIVVRKDGHEFKVTSVMHDAQGRDLALIKVEGLGCPCAIPAEFPALQDEAVMIVGYPYGIGPITTFGHVQIRTGLQDWDEHTYLLVTAKAGPGNSGGPLFVIRNGQPYLVGIVVLGIGGPHLTGAVELP